MPETSSHRETPSEPRALARAASGDSPDAKTPSPVPLGRYLVGPGERVFIVAEAGVNHNGSVELAVRMVEVAARAGADAVKFQVFRAADVATPSAPTARYQRDTGEAESQRAMLARLELSLDDFARIKRACDDQAIQFMATPFSEADLIRLLALKTEAIKIASTDLTNAPLLRAVAASKLPIILSTGASTVDEMQAAVDDLRAWRAADRLVLLHCVSCYPTPPSAINLRAIAALEQRFGLPCGLSDHTTLEETGGWAAIAGACLLEKHFTLDKTDSGPDHATSLDPTQLAEYVRQARAAGPARGDGRLGMTDLEAEVRAVAGKSVVAAADIRRGNKLVRGMLACKRPGTGLAPRELERLVGRTALLDIPRDTILSWDMVR